MFFWNKWVPDYTQKALTYYKKAIEIEPDFALAYTGVAACNIFLGAIDVYPRRIAYPEAKKYATKALEIDDTIPEAYVSVAMLKFFDEWDWDGAEKNFLKAIELNPNSAMGHQYYGMLLATLGYYKKAIKELELAHSLDPLNAPISSLLAFNYFNSNLFDQAQEQYERTNEIDPEFHESWSGSGWLHHHRGDLDGAIKIFESVIKRTGFKNKSLAALGYLYAKTDKMDQAKKCLSELEELDSEDLPLDVDLAVIHVGMGEIDKAFELLNSAFEKKLSGLNFIKSKHWKDIFSDPRYNELLKKMNLPLD
jgi:tetratricopeptide (TPR) repeat protein